MRSLRYALAGAALLYSSLAYAATPGEIKRLVQMLQSVAKPNPHGWYVAGFTREERTYLFVYDDGKCHEGCDEQGDGLIGYTPHEPFLLVVLSDFPPIRVANRYEMEDIGLDGVVDKAHDKLEKDHLYANERGSADNSIIGERNSGAWQELFDTAIALALNH